LQRENLRGFVSLETKEPQADERARENDGEHQRIAGWMAKTGKRACRALGAPTCPSLPSFSTTYSRILGAKKRRLARREPTWPAKLLKTNKLMLAERVGFEPKRTV
jgi:hypothetical protein